MDEPLKTNFVQEMREVLKKQLSDFETNQRKQCHDAKILADEGLRRWNELKSSLKSHVEQINDGLADSLSYSEAASGNSLSLRHELSGREIEVTFNPTSAVISYQGNKGEGEFPPRVEGDSLEYGWHEITSCGPRPLRKIRRYAEDAPVTLSSDRMSEILIRCTVLEPTSDD